MCDLAAEGLPLEPTTHVTLDKSTGDDVQEQELDDLRRGTLSLAS